MDPIISELTEEEVPRGHKELLHGLAKTQLMDSALVVDKIFREASRSFPSCLQYEGYKVLTPDECYKSLLDISGNKEYDIAKCSLYMAEFVFSTDIDGERVYIPRRIFLPYIENDGSIYLSGNKYYFKPVLTDRIISATGGGFFIRLMQDKFPCGEKGYNICINNEIKMVFVLEVPVFNKLRPRRGRKTLIEIPNAVHYILSKYGLQDTFSKYLKKKNIKIIPKSSITPSHMDDFYVYTSAKHIDLDIAFIIPKDDVKTISDRETIDAYMAGIFQVLDRYGVSNRDKKPTITMENIYDKRSWKNALTNLLITSTYSGKVVTYPSTVLLREISIHYERLDTYLERQLQDYLSHIGVRIENFYDLLHYIISHSKHLRAANNVWMKYLDVSYYIFYKFIETIFSVKNTIVGKLAAGNRVTSKDISKLLQKLSTRMFLNITKGGSRNIVLDTVDYPGDNIYLGMTQLITLQELGDGVAQGGRNTTSVLPPSVKRLHSYDIAVGSLLAVFKSRPTPRVRLNLYVQYDIKTGKVVTSPRYRKKMDTLQKLIDGSLRWERLPD